METATFDPYIHFNQTSNLLETSMGLSTIPTYCSEIWDPTSCSNTSFGYLCHLPHLINDTLNLTIFNCLLNNVTNIFNCLSCDYLYHTPTLCEIDLIANISSVTDEFWLKLPIPTCPAQDIILGKCNDIVSSDGNNTLKAILCLFDSDVIPPTSLTPDDVDALPSFSNSGLFIPDLSDSGNGSEVLRDIIRPKYDWSFLFVGLFILAGGVGNILVCLAVCFDRRLQNVTNYFLLSLAIADLLVSLFVMPMGAIPGFLGK